SLGDDGLLDQGKQKLVTERRIVQRLVVAGHRLGRTAHRVRKGTILLDATPLALYVVGAGITSVVEIAAQARPRFAEPGVSGAAGVEACDPGMNTVAIVGRSGE